ncbi:MAG: cation transporter [Planctomycetes bacterium]|nr:cation transporter [Planctomycetota bacterium]
MNGGDVVDTTNEKNGEYCDAGVKAATKASAQCPACGIKGKTVKSITIESLVVEEARNRAGRSDGFRFCAEPSCEVAYFHPETGAQISESEVRVRIGQKETQAPRPVCYCFEHTVEEIAAEVVATGTSKVADDITAKCRQGLDRCEETNPQGSCCLGNVRLAMKEAQERAKSEPVTVAAASSEAESCCAVGSAEAPAARARRPRNTGLWATTGAVVSAILSSACCWLPLLLIAFGASAAGVAGFFEAYRPLLLGATGLLLAGGFYLVYFRKEKCEPGEACAVPNPRLQRFNKIMLWVATAVVLAFALFPDYVGYLLGNGDPHAPPLTAAPATGESRVFRIDGMTCAACAVTLREQLGSVPGVARAEVSFERKTARVFFAAGEEAPSAASLLGTIQQGGYSGTPVASSRTVQIGVSGLTCAGRASGLEARLRGLAGVEAARVDYESSRATVTVTPDASLDAVLQAIAEQGFGGKVEQTKVEMDLERDLFTVTAAKDRPAEAEMIAAIDRRGFKATVQRPRGESGSTSEPARPEAASGAMSPLVLTALDRARREGKLVLVDFYADWCLPCMHMLKETYQDPQVVSELEHFVFLKVDTDDNPDVSRRFGVAGIPDARVLKADGTEVARFVGFKRTDEVLGILRAARGASRGIW